MVSINTSVTEIYLGPQTFVTELFVYNYPVLCLFRSHSFYFHCPFTSFTISRWLNFHWNLCFQKCWSCLYICNAPRRCSLLFPCCLFRTSSIVQRYVRKFLILVCHERVIGSSYRILQSSIDWFSLEGHRLHQTVCPRNSEFGSCRIWSSCFSDNP